MGAPSPRVLVVDDEPSIRLLCRVNLELEGFAILEAGTLDDAREALADGPDIVLLDVNVGGEDGRDLLDELKTELPDLPVLMLTGTSEFTQRQHPPDGVIAKPFDPIALAGSIRKVLAGGRHV